MISNPESIHYLCIAKSSTILAHHLPNPDDESLASQCLALAPPNHSLFSQTLHNRTYTFLFDPPFLIFAIFDHHLPKSQSLSFLHRLRSLFRQSLSRHDHRDFTHLSFQPQFDSIFSNALRGDRSPDPSPPLLPAPPQAQPQHGLKKKKRDAKDVSLLDLSDDVVSRQHLVHDRQKAKHIWKKHVWVVLLLDLFVCTVLFVIWLWVCSGFKCMTY